MRIGDTWNDLFGPNVSDSDRPLNFWEHSRLRKVVEMEFAYAFVRIASEVDVPVDAVMQRQVHDAVIPPVFMAVLHGRPPMPASLVGSHDEVWWSIRARMCDEIRSELQKFAACRTNRCRFRVLKRLCTKAVLLMRFFARRDALP